MKNRYRYIIMAIVVCCLSFVAIQVQHSVLGRPFLMGVIPISTTYPPQPGELDLCEEWEAVKLADEYGEIIHIIGDVYHYSYDEWRALIEDYEDLDLEVMYLIELYSGHEFLYEHALHSDGSTNYTQMFSLIAVREKPEYLDIMPLINNYLKKNPEDTERALSLYQDTYKEIKEQSPETKVFASFSYETVTGGRGGPAQWDVFEKFEPYQDIAVFSTSPWQICDNPGELSGYYLEIPNHTTKRIGFIRIEWPSSPHPFSEESQSQFLTLFVEETKGFDLEFLCWSDLHDYMLYMGSEDYHKEAYSHLGLLYSDGTPKPVWQVWKTLYEKGDRMVEDILTVVMVAAAVFVCEVSLRFRKR